VRPSDGTIARLVASKLRGTLGRTVIVDSRSGAQDRPWSHMQRRRPGPKRSCAASFAALHNDPYDVVGWHREGSVRRRDTVGRKPAKTQHRKPTRPKRSNAPTAARRGSSSFADLQKQVAILAHELGEAREQQIAASEVLQIISRSAGEPRPVFEALLENATMLCEANYGAMWLREGDAFRGAAFHGDLPAAYTEQFETPFRPSAEEALARVAHTRKPVHIADFRKYRAYLERRPLAVAGVEVAGIRTFFVVPMLKHNELVGAIAIYRREMRPFTNSQILLVQNFAAQAVIAIENTRLLNELRQRTDDLSEALEQQTATSEVLRVISSSPGELESVFRAMLENATRICEAKFGTLFLREDDTFRVVAQNLPPNLAELRQRDPLVRPGPTSSLVRSAKTKQAVQIADMRADPGYAQRDPLRVALVEIGGIRSVVSVPMLKEAAVVGIFNIYREKTGSFSSEQVELVQNFAAQAVIAIENTRLLNELKQRTNDLSESLEQQTATAEVLKTISRAAFDLQRVLETLLESAVRLAGAKHGMIFRYDGECCRAAAGYNNPPGFLELWQRTPIRAGRETATGRALLERRPVQITDAQADSEYDFPEALKLQGFRTVLAVPLLRQGVPLGTIGMWKTEVAPFTNRQIELVTTFADQAVIAIENVRLFDDLQVRTRDLSESLQQQTATAEVLKVISRSTFDLKSVLQTLVESAARLCDADKGTITRQIDGVFYRAECYGFPAKVMERACHARAR
jgi:GAF domain-containing protein